LLMATILESAGVRHSIGADERLLAAYGRRVRSRLLPGPGRIPRSGQGRRQDRPGSLGRRRQPERCLARDVRRPGRSCRTTPRQGHQAFQELTAALTRRPNVRIFVRVRLCFWKVIHMRNVLRPKCQGVPLASEMTGKQAVTGHSIARKHQRCEPWRQLRIVKRRSRQR
jgi:hypothetical protein